MPAQYTYTIPYQIQLSLITVSLSTVSPWMIALVLRGGLTPTYIRVRVC